MTKEELLSKETFEELFRIPNKFDRAEKQAKLIGISKDLKCQREFNSILKIYEKEFADKVSFDNEIVIKDIPLTGLHLDKFICNNRGVFKKGERICYTPVIICEILTNKDTKNEKVRLAVYNTRTKKWEYCVVDSRCLTASNRILKLNEYKVSIDSENAREMVKYFTELKNENINIIPTGECFSSLGWNGDNFAPYNNLNILDNADDFKQIFSAIKEQGDYNKWLEIVKEARKNKYVKIAMATTFASPLLEKLNVMPYIVNLWSSKSGNGKTVGCMIAMSVWGDPSNKGLQFSSDSTKNYYMKVASFLKNITMYCDEFQKVKSSNLDELVMMLANGKDKGRLNIDRKSEEECSWSNNFLFTNNDKISKTNYGEQVFNRIIDVECDGNVIEKGKGNEIVRIIKENYGFAGKIYIEYITKVGFNKINERVQAYVRELCENYSATEKQAACISTLLVANELSQECLFADEDKLTIEDIKDSINNKQEIETWRKAYQYIINDFAENKRCFEDDNKSPKSWGKKEKKENNFIYTVNKNTLEEELKKGEYEFNSIKKDWDKMGIIQKNSENKFTWNTTVNGTRGRYVVINIKEEFLN